MLKEMSLHHEERKSSYFVIYGEVIPFQKSLKFHDYKYKYLSIK